MGIRIDIADGIIELDSPFGRDIGFTTDKFHDSWLWKSGNRIIISMIIANTIGAGYFSALLKNIRRLEYEVAVPTPMGKMVAILEAKGAKKTREWNERYGEYIEVWLL